MVYERKKKNYPIAWAVATAFACAFFLFYNSLRYQYPLGFGGLFTLMAQRLAGENFFPPQTIPYYGPGGIPFAYPPLGVYLMASALKLDISFVTYLRFVPPLFSFMAVMALYWFTVQTTGSNPAGSVAAIFAAASPALYVMHVWSAGAVRAVAFFIMICGFIALRKSIMEKSVTWGAVTGVLFGMTALTHLFYALFFGLWAAGWMLTNFSRSLIKPALAALAAALGVTLPWLIMIQRRYGLDIFLSAYSSHDNDAFTNVLQTPSLLGGWLGGKILALDLPYLIYPCLLAGIVFLLLSRRYEILLATLLSMIVLSGESERFTVLSAAILLGYSVAAAHAWFSKSKTITLLSYLLVFIGLFQAGYSGFKEISQTAPILDNGMFELADFVRENTSSNARYLFVAGQAEAEWFPLLLGREPFSSKWGSEWLGTYYEQRALQSAISACRDVESLDCLMNLNLEFSGGDFVITAHRDKDLNVQLEATVLCRRMKVVGPYDVWSADCFMN